MQRNPILGTKWLKAILDLASYLAIDLVIETFRSLVDSEVCHSATPPSHHVNNADKYP